MSLFNLFGGWARLGGSGAGGGRFLELRGISRVPDAFVTVPGNGRAAGAKICHGFLPIAAIC